MMDYIAEMQPPIGYTGRRPWNGARPFAPGFFGILWRKDFVFPSRGEALDYINNCRRQWREDLYGKPPKFRIRTKAVGGRCDHCGEKPCDG